MYLIASYRAAHHIRLVPCTAHMKASRHTSSVQIRTRTDYNYTDTISLHSPQRRNRFSISAINPGTSFDTTAQSTASLISISAPSNCLSACPPFSVHFSPHSLRIGAESLLSHSIMIEEQRGRRRGRLTLASTNLRDNGSYSNNRVIGLLNGISYSS
jgi:hypothetical protein